MFSKSSVGVKLSNCLNAKKKKYIWNMKYTIQHSIERSQTTKCIQYNIYDTMSCELPTYVLKICIGFVLLNCLNAKKIHLEYEIHNTT